MFNVQWIELANFPIAKVERNKKKYPPYGGYIWWVLWVVIILFLKTISCTYLMEFGRNIGYFIHNHPFSFFRRFLRAINVLSH